MRKEQSGGEQCEEQYPLWLTQGRLSKLQRQVFLVSLITCLHAVGTQHLQCHQQRGHSGLRETTEAMSRTEVQGLNTDTSQILHVQADAGKLARPSSEHQEWPQAPAGSLEPRSTHPLIWKTEIGSRIKPLCHGLEMVLPI